MDTQAPPALTAFPLQKAVGPFIMYGRLRIALTHTGKPEVF